MKGKGLSEIVKVSLLTFCVTFVASFGHERSSVILFAFIAVLAVSAFSSLLLLLLSRSGALDEKRLKKHSLRVCYLFFTSMIFFPVALFSEHEGIDSELSLISVLTAILLFRELAVLKRRKRYGRLFLVSLTSSLILVFYPAIVLSGMLSPEPGILTYITGLFVGGAVYSSLFNVMMFFFILEEGICSPMRMLAIVLAFSLILSAILLLPAKSVKKTEIQSQKDRDYLVNTVIVPDEEPSGDVGALFYEEADMETVQIPEETSSADIVEEGIDIPEEASSENIVAEGTEIQEEQVNPEDHPLEENISSAEEHVEEVVAFPIEEVIEEESLESVQKEENPLVSVDAENRDGVIADGNEEVFASLPDSAEAESGSEDVSSGEEPLYYHDAIYDEDFFADFFIQGEDSLSLADGTYFMLLVINGDAVGQISVELANGELGLNTSELREYLDGNITDEAFDRIFLGSGNSITLSDLNSIGIDSSYDSSLYEVYLTFSSEDMPVRMLSLRGTGGIQRRPILGATELEPAVFTLASRFTLSTDFYVSDFDTFKNTLDFTLSSSNSVRIGKVLGNFNWYMDWDLDSFDFRMGSYEFYTDFEDEMIRLSWGNVDTDLLSPSGTPFGIRFEKAIDYAAPGVRSRSHLERVITLEKQSEVTVYNEGREIFNRTLDPGNYRLSDFILYTGANRIRIVISPLDGTMPEVIEFDVNYSSSLLAPGETYYGASLTMGRRTVSSSSSMIDGAFRIPLWDGRSLEYDFRNLVFSGFVTSGLSESLTMDFSAAFGNSVDSSALFNPSAVLALELTHANVLGTTRYNFRVTEHADRNEWVYPDIYARIGHQVYTDWTPISSFNLSATYNGDLDTHTLSLSTGLSGSIGIFGWSVNGYLSTPITDWSSLNYSVSGSFSFSLGRYLWLSASLDVNGNDVDAPPIVEGRVTATFRFGGGSVGASYSSYGYSYLEGSYNDSHNSFSARIDNPNAFADINSYGISGDYTYTGTYAKASVGLDASDLFNYTRMNMSLSTSTLFADGLFTVRSTIPSNYVLINQGGALKDNDLSVGRAGNSSTSILPEVFGSSLYTGIPSSGSTYLSLFSIPDGGFGSAESFDIAIPASNIKGYVLRLSAEERYSVSGIVHFDGVPWYNGSSPLYEVSVEDGTVNLDTTESYVFTDRDGRFVLNDLLPGVYAFDADDENGEWHLVIFTIDADGYEEGGDLLLLDDYRADSELSLPSIYSDAFVFGGGESITQDEFWNLMYPEAAV